MSATTPLRRSPRQAAASQRVSADSVVTETIPKTAEVPAARETPFLVGMLGLTTLVGSLISLRTHHTSVTSFRSRLPASTMNASTIPSPLPYFSDKRNVFNQVFVKYGWAWTTGAVALYLVATLSSPSAKFRSNRLLRVTRRYAIATAYWWVLTQGTWFFGPALAHHILMYTGAECVPASIESGNVLGMSDSGMGASPAEMIRAPGVCNPRNGEYWKGGHDVRLAFLM